LDDVRNLIRYGNLELSRHALGCNTINDITEYTVQIMQSVLFIP